MSSLSSITINLFIPILLIVYSISVYSGSVHATTFDPSSSEKEESFPDKLSNCVVFDSDERILTINCKTANLSDVNNQLNNTDIIHKDEAVE